METLGGALTLVVGAALALLGAGVLALGVLALGGFHQGPLGALLVTAVGAAFLALGIFLGTHGLRALQRRKES